MVAIPWKPQHPGAIGAYLGLYRDNFACGCYINDRV
jgi:hypothetical protein